MRGQMQGLCVKDGLGTPSPQTWRKKKRSQTLQEKKNGPDTTTIEKHSDGKAKKGNYKNKTRNGHGPGTLLGVRCKKVAEASS